VKNDRIKDELSYLAFARGADFVGVADLISAGQFITEQYGEAMAEFPRAVVAAVIFPKEVVNELKDAPTHTYLNYYKALNVRLDDIALSISNFLQRKGFRSFPIPASQRVTESRLSAIFSHRLAGNLAGLGWIGKSSNFIHPEVGPRLRLVTVLTDCPLPASDQKTEDRCGSCRLCADACPAHAIKGVNFHIGQPLSERFDAKACDAYLSKVRVTFGKRICGRCMAVCPHGY
jgi:epoxyqueuosine reductase QueG